MPPRAFLVPSEQYRPAPHRRPTPRSRLHPTPPQAAIFNPYARGRVYCGRGLIEYTQMYPRRPPDALPG
nr:MAG TPA: hypothetical protein [Caudoviricetes sp.]